MASASEWHDLGVSSDSLDNGLDLKEFLELKGLTKHAQRIIDVTEAECVGDLKLIDTRMVEEVVNAADLKLVSAQKFRNLVAELRGEHLPSTPPPPPGPPPPLGHAPADSAKGADAGSAYPEAAPAPVQVQERVAICIDRSGSMGCPFNEITVNVVDKAVQQRTRMEAVKAMFYAFRDRTATLGQGAHEMGLIQFDDRVEELLGLTSDLDCFEAIVDNMEKRGTTAIYSSIVAAAEMLGRTFQEDSPTDLRILVLTDGQSNAGAAPEEALAAVNRVGAVVDAIIVGDKPDAHLRRIVTATEGECYQIHDLGEGFELLEAESVVSLRARRGGSDKPPFKLRDAVSFHSLTERQLTRGTAVQRAPALDPTLSSTVVASMSSTLSRGAASFSCQGSAATKRILMELKKVHENDKNIWLRSGEGIHIFPAPDKIDFWRVLLEGPPGSPFEGGVFALHVTIPNDYPYRPAKIKFETPIYHCNVNDSGAICLDFLEQKWNPTLSVPKALEAVRDMMATPDTDNALRQWIAELTLAHIATNGTDTRYYEKATESLQKHATKTVSEWKQEWGC